MSGFSEGEEPKSTPKSSSGGSNQEGSASCIPEQDSSQTETPKASSWLFTTRFSVFNTTSSASPSKKEVKAKNYWWITSIRKAMNGGLMRRLQERMLGTGKMDVSSSTSEIWLLGACYKASPEEPPNDENLENSLSAFQEDFTTKIWITYRKGFAAIGDSKFTSDVNWGCMIRSSQMLVAQALIFHYLGRSWRNTQKPYDPKYIELLHHFGESEDSAYSIHNLLLAGKGYGLAAGCWVGPYAMCRSWEVLSNSNEESSDTAPKKQRFPLTVYIVSGDEDGERGGAPVVYVDVACKLSFASNNGEPNWSPMLLLVPLVLGLDKINPRYIPLLWATFTFPQSLGILGGKPGASTYIVGVQDDKALYLDPHEVQQVINISGYNLEADTSSYHCSTMKSLPLEQIDPSLAIGFYCRDKDDFDDFCSRATELAGKSNGAPLFTVDRSQQTPKKNHHIDDPGNTSSESHDNGSGNVLSYSDIHQSEDEWQLL